MADGIIAKQSPQLTALLKRTPLCVGESKAQYEQLRDLIFAEINPGSVSEYMLACDIAIAEWELLRLHGVKAGIVNANAYYELDSGSASRLLKEAEVWDAPELFRKASSGENPNNLEKLKSILERHNLSLDEITSKAFEKSIVTQAQIELLVNSAFRRRDTAYAELERRRTNSRKQLSTSEPKQIEAVVVDSDTTSIVPDEPAPVG